MLVFVTPGRGGEPSAIGPSLSARVACVSSISPRRMSARSSSYRFSAGPASPNVRGTSRLNDDARTVGRVKASALVGPGARFQGLKMRRGLGIRYGLRLAASRRKANPRFHTHRGDQQAGHCTLHTVAGGHWWPRSQAEPGWCAVVPMRATLSPAMENRTLSATRATLRALRR